MKTLYILRHAKSGWDSLQLGDHERTLDKQGVLDAIAMGQWLQSHQISFDLVYCSTAKRTKETIKYLLGEMNCTPKIDYTKQLYLANVETYFKQAKSVLETHQSVLFVGHNGGISDFLTHITQEWTSMPPCAIGEVTIPTAWHETSPACGILQNYWTPKNIQ